MSYPLDTYMWTTSARITISSEVLQCKPRASSLPLATPMQSGEMVYAWYNNLASTLYARQYLDGGGTLVRRRRAQGYAYRVVWGRVTAEPSYAGPLGGIAVGRCSSPSISTISGLSLSLLRTTPIRLSFLSSSLLVIGGRLAHVPVDSARETGETHTTPEGSDGAGVLREDDARDETGRQAVPDIVLGAVLLSVWMNMKRREWRVEKGDRCHRR